MAWQSFEASVSGSCLTLLSDLVDLPASAGTCRPTNLLGSELREILVDASNIAPREPVGHAVHRIPAHSRTEYLRLTGLELTLGKLILRTEAAGIGSIFPVAKSGDRQRAVWHGTLVSEASQRPVRPRRLGNPAALLALDWPADARVRWSKRDAASFFDTLCCPEELQTWFGRPPVRVSELLEHTELTLEDIGLLCVPVAPLGSLSADDSLVPCSRVWPMGYSWSSAVAQDVSLGLLRCEGFDEEQVICVEEPPPCNQSDCVFVLTDDCIMAHVARAKDSPGGFSKQQAAARVQQLDHAMQANGVQRKIGKDVTVPMRGV